MFFDVIFLPDNIFVWVGQYRQSEILLMVHLDSHVLIINWARFLSSFLMIGWSGLRFGISCSLSCLYSLPILLDLNLGIIRLPMYSLRAIFLINAISESGGFLSNVFQDLLISLIV